MQDTSPTSTVLRYERPPAPPAGPEPFDRLKELVANGYVPEAGAPGEGGILLRHKSAPDLILYPDGRIDVPIGQAAKRFRNIVGWRKWLRILALIVLGGAFWVISVGATLVLLEGIFGG